MITTKKSFFWPKSLSLNISMKMTLYWDHFEKIFSKTIKNVFCDKYKNRILPITRLISTFPPKPCYFAITLKITIFEIIWKKSVFAHIFEKNQHLRKRIFWLSFSYLFPYGKNGIITLVKNMSWGWNLKNNRERYRHVYIFLISRKKENFLENVCPSVRAQKLYTLKLKNQFNISLF